jgi:rare lipoprotein A
MKANRGMSYCWLALLLAVTPAWAAHDRTKPPLALHPPVAGSQLDPSGRKRTGHASYYGRHIHRQLADGTRFNPNSNAAASRTLPFGTTAKVTDLKTGRSALVQVEDRGPMAPSRIVDVTPKVADQLGMAKAGVTPVVVAPVAVPQPDGEVKLGAGAAEVSPPELDSATRVAGAATR